MMQKITAALANCKAGAAAAEFEEALALPSKPQFGNGAGIFARNGHDAREFAARVNAGMVEIKMPFPAPVTQR